MVPDRCGIRHDCCCIKHVSGDHRHHRGYLGRPADICMYNSCDNHSSLRTTTTHFDRGMSSGPQKPRLQNQDFVNLCHNHILPLIMRSMKRTGKKSSAETAANVEFSQPNKPSTTVL